MQKYLIRNIQIVNEGRTFTGDVLLKDERIEKIGTSIQQPGSYTEIDGEGKWLLPGAIDDQVHFREPGLTHKANIYTESKAAVAGGVTSFMEMPNTIPNALTQALLEEKYAIERRLPWPIIRFSWAPATTTPMKYLEPMKENRMFAA
jgi:dihydroorotase